MLRNLGVFKYVYFNQDELKVKALAYLGKVKSEQSLKIDPIERNSLRYIEKIKRAIQGNQLVIDDKPEDVLNLIRSAVILDDPTDDFPILSILFKMGITFTQEDINWTRNSLKLSADILQKYYNEKIEPSLKYKT